MPDFHREIGFPEDVTIPTGRVLLDPTAHARREARSPRWLEDGETIDIPQAVTIHEEHVFELTVKGGEVTKLGARFTYPPNPDHDLVCIIDPRDGTLITLWTNYKTDTHETLDESEYTDPEQYTTAV